MTRSNLFCILHDLTLCCCPCLRTTAFSLTSGRSAGPTEYQGIFVAEGDYSLKFSSSQGHSKAFVTMVIPAMPPDVRGHVLARGPRAGTGVRSMNYPPPRRANPPTTVILVCSESAHLSFLLVFLLHAVKIWGELLDKTLLTSEP